MGEGKGPRTWVVIRVESGVISVVNSQDTPRKPLSFGERLRTQLNAVVTLAHMPQASPIGILRRLEIEEQR